MTDRLKILLLCSTDPADTSAGGEQRTHLVHRALGQVGEVYTLIPVPLPRFESTDGVGRVLRRCIERRYSLGWMLDRLAARHLQVMRFSSHRRHAIARCWPGIRFDYVVARSVMMAAYTRAWEIAPLFLDSDDLPEECYRTLYAKPSGGWFWRIHDACAERLISRWARRIRCRARGVWFANESHIKLLGHSNAGWLPNLPREPRQEPSDLDQQAGYILSVGLMWYSPNHTGVERFLANVWPAIRAAHPNLEYWIAGRDTPESCRESWTRIPGVRVLGFVEDIEAVYRGAIFSVAPVYTGSGTSIKVVESLRLGRACVAPRFAARGIDHLLGRDDGLFVVDSDEELLSSALWLLDHPDERRRLQLRAVDRVKQVCSLDAFAASVRRVIEEGLASAG